jgi:diaminopimelate epimerase
MELEIVRADPAGNITIFVLTPVAGREARIQAARALLQAADLRAEQVGFVMPPPDGSGRWRLEMAGGEFCGNAARSFGLWVAAQTGLTGRHTLPIEASGQAEPLPVRVDTAAGTAEVAIPGPEAETALTCGDRQFPVYRFAGITHIIAGDVEPDEALLPPLIKRLDAEAGHPPDALGLMFYDTRKRFMRPLVWVRAAGSTVFESSCGSGSAALGVWAARHTRDGEARMELAQPGGVITVRVVKRAGRVRRIFIGGRVGLSGVIGEIV